MTYLSDLHAYLHQSSLLIQAYPSTRISTKYSLPRRTTRPQTQKSKQTVAAAADVDTQSHTTSNTQSKDQQQSRQQQREKREPAATLTLKTFHPESGICLKYRTDKAQEVGRLFNGLGRLAKGEIIEMPSSTTGTANVTSGNNDTAMDVDAEQPSTTTATTTTVVKDGKTELTTAARPGGLKSAAEITQGQQQQQQQPSKKKKKGGKK